MTREVDTVDDASLRSLEMATENENINIGSIDTEEDDDEESDGDFVLETMGDDDEDDDDDDADAEHELDQMPSFDADDDELRDELMALAEAAADDAVGTKDDTIAHRTRTKLSLVDVEIDSLESLLPPDPMDSSLVGGENEYQRFLASLLPTGGEEDNLSFLDEEDEEYRPEDDDDEDAGDDEDEQRQRAGAVGSEGDTPQSANGEHVEDDDDDDDDDDDRRYKQTLRVSKRELTELLWDSTQLKVPPTFAKGMTEEAEALVTTVGKTKSGVTAQNAEAVGKDVRDHVGTTTETVEGLKDSAAVKELDGSVSPQQCIQLASQMHKHFQLLLQTFHMIANPEEAHMKTEEGDKITTRPPVDKDQLDEYAAMLRELQIRGKRALEYKAQVLSKLTVSSRGGSSTPTSSERLGDRRVTRSISAAHAAVANPSMFDIVGSQSMEELTEAFERGCSMSERNHKLQESMHELDKHILLHRKKRRSSASRKILFFGAEDRLLLQGVKRYGVEPHSWEEIQKNLLPTKEANVLSKRYRYLASKKKRGGQNEFKDFNSSEITTRTKGQWMIEEDVRIARGVVEYFGDNRPFSRISSKYLPHRSREEIRKRWERLKERYRIEDGEIKEVKAIDDILVTRVAAREFAVAVKRYIESKLRRKLVELPIVLAAPTNKKAPRRTKPSETAKTSNKDNLSNHGAAEVSTCNVKNLHPALFFSSWAVIHPATLLENTCEHNWPAFIREKRNDVANESTVDLVSRAAASRVEEEAATHRADKSSVVGQLEPIREDQDEDDDEMASSGLDFSIGTVDSEGDGDEEESDFEREELLSSDESDSEYERMELSDNDGDEDDVDDESFDEGDASHDDTDSVPDTQPTQVKHPLRLSNLRQPGDTRTMRALEALERRITGNRLSVAGSTTGFTPLRLDSAPFEPLSANEVPFNEDDLLAYEELSDSPSSEGDDEYEQDELRSSSDEDEEYGLSEDVTLVDRPKRLSEIPVDQPLKRPKLHDPPTRCRECGGMPCVCSSDRMQRLMARMLPPGSSS